MRMEEVRKRFPNPRAFSRGLQSQQSKVGEYSVGGALGLALRHASTLAAFSIGEEGLCFPHEEQLAVWLKDVNASLRGKDKLALKLAVSIIRHSDRGAFDIAWEVLRLAMEDEFS